MAHHVLIPTDYVKHDVASNRSRGILINGKRVRFLLRAWAGLRSRTHLPV